MQNYGIMDRTYHHDLFNNVHHYHQEFGHSLIFKGSLEGTTF